MTVRIALRQSHPTSAVLLLAAQYLGELGQTFLPLLAKLNKLGAES